MYAVESQPKTHTLVSDDPFLVLFVGRKIGAIRRLIWQKHLRLFLSATAIGEGVHI